MLPPPIFTLTITPPANRTPSMATAGSQRAESGPSCSSLPAQADPGQRPAPVAPAGFGTAREFQQIDHGSQKPRHRKPVDPAEPRPYRTGQHHQQRGAEAARLE